MTTVWIKANGSEKFLGFYCSNCDWVWNGDDLIGVVICGTCPNCKQDVLPFYDISDNAIHVIKEDNNDS